VSTDRQEICAAGSGIENGPAVALGMLKLKAIDSDLRQLVADRSDETLNGTVLHPWAGLEVVSIGFAAAREDGDVVFASHRGLGHCLAWGVDPHRAVAETLGRETGFARGRGGHMHVVDPPSGIGGTNGIVAGGLPPAVGAALSMQVRGLPNVVVAFCGDGATNTGAFHESLNLAAVWRLPLVVVCEDNGITEAMNSKAQRSAPSLIARGEAYGVTATEVAGDDLGAIYGAAQEAFARARDGKGPSFVICQVDRPGGHYAGDRQHYRDQADAERAARTDPVGRAIARLDLDDGELAELSTAASAYARQLVENALADEPPSREVLLIGNEESPRSMEETVL
jgi:TPP-dependent pyruvate/acetoin dehydrogenase alpha subunit